MVCYSAFSRFHWRICFGSLCLILSLFNASLGAARETPPSSSWLAGIYANLSGHSSEADFLLSDPDILSATSSSSVVRDRVMRTALAAGHVERAVHTAEQANAQDPSWGLSQLILMADALSRRRPEAAENYASNISNILFESVLKTMMTAWSHVGQGEGQAAIRELEALSEDIPDGLKQEYKLQRALIALAIGDTAQAQRILDDLLEASAPAPALAARAHIAYVSGQEAKARNFIETFSEIQTLEWEERIFSSGPFIADYRSGAAESIYSVTRAVERQSRHLNWALMYSQIGHIIDPTHIRLSLLNVRLASHQGDTELAKKSIESLRSRVASHFQPLITNALADIEVNSGDTSAAIKTLKGLVATHPELRFAWQKLGNFYRYEGQHKEAIGAYTRAVDLLEEGHEDWSLYYVRGISNHMSEDWEAALADLERANEISPDNPDVLNHIGYTWLERGEKLEQARDMVLEAAKQKPNDPYIIDSVGWAYYVLGDFHEAIVHLEKAAQRLAYDPTINDHLGDAYWRAGREREARYTWKRALSETDDDELKSQLTKKLDVGLSG